MNKRIPWKYFSHKIVVEVAVDAKEVITGVDTTSTQEVVVLLKSALETWDHLPHPGSTTNKTSTLEDHVWHARDAEKQGRDALRFDISYQQEYLPQGLNAVHITEVADDKWHPDVGANTTNDKVKLIYLYPYKGSDSITVGNSAALPIAHIEIGSIGHDNCLALNNIIVVSQIMKNLLSVS